MIEKVNPKHPDKIADRISGALVDYCYSQEENPRVAIEVLIGHGTCTIIAETSVYITEEVAQRIVDRIAGKHKLNLICVAQNSLLADNQREQIKAGDNGIFKGTPLTNEQKRISELARKIYRQYPYDGKYIIDGEKITICQSNARTEDLQKIEPKAIINPIGDWYGGTDVDSGATNRKLGSDMADSVTGGGLHGKDLSKADVSVNIYAWLKAQETREEVRLSCSIGDTEIDGRPYQEIVDIARKYIKMVGGFEKFAEWGLF